MSSRSLEYWRDYFKGVSSHIFDIIDGAIMVAAADYPEEFSLRRCTIAERLSPPCLAVSDGVEKVEAKKIKEIKIVNKSCDEHAEMNVKNHNIRDVEAEALNDQIEHESQSLMEVLRIRDILFNYREQTLSELHEALRRLQLMNLTLDLLQETEIGKAVNLLRKHQSKDISELARILIEDWKNEVDEWLKVDTPIADSENPPLDDEAGLPSPPMDEGALFSYPPVSMEPSKFFDGLDDDGNPLQREEVTRNRSQNMMPKRKSQAPNEAKMVSKDNTIEPKKKNKLAVAVRLNKPLTADNVEPEMMQKKILERPSKSNMAKRDNMETGMMQKSVLVLKGSIQRRSPQVGQSNKLKLDADALEEKFEASKRKLQDHYQQAQSAKRQRTAQYVEFNDLPKQTKRQRTAQYVEFDDLPKQGPGRQIPPTKPKKQKRPLAAGRRFIQE